MIRTVPVSQRIGRGIESAKIAEMVLVTDAMLVVQKEKQKDAQQSGPGEKGDGTMSNALSARCGSRGRINLHTQTLPLEKEPTMTGLQKRLGHSAKCGFSAIGQR